MKNAMFPMFVDLAGKTTVVVGGGAVALRKARTLLRCGASVRVVAPDVVPELRALAGSGRVALIERRYERGDLDGAEIVVAATNDRSVNRRVALDAGEMEKIPVNVADAPGECSFFFPALVEHEGYAAGVSSSGKSPAKCRALADRLRAVWRDWVDDVG